jgi:hypothetical protein
VSSREERDHGNRPAFIMTMCMVHVRHMWVDVLHRLMFVKMCMRLAWGVDGTVRMTMVFIMHVRMGVAYGRMEVLNVHGAQSGAATLRLPSIDLRSAVAPRPPHQML